METGFKGQPIQLKNIEDEYKKNNKVQSKERDALAS